ncbi:MAG: transketolase C-terminal domain-containing protein, partial [Candidatus Aenigmatarchaeota archaeon]
MGELSRVFDRPIKYQGLREAYGEALARLGEKYEDIVVLDADLSSSTKTSIFAKKFPDRFFNMGVAEQNMMGFAAGLAAAGKIPFVSTFAIFASGRAWEQVRQSIAYPSLNVKIVATHGGITVGEDGASHQCTEDIALMRVLPNMTIIIPTDAVETEKVIETIVKIHGPFYIRISRAKFPVIFDSSHSFEVGKGYILKDGEDIAIIATGLMVSYALEAAIMAEKEGISVLVAGMPTIKPLD